MRCASFDVQWRNVTLLVPGVALMSLDPLVLPPLTPPLPSPATLTPPPLPFSQPCPSPTALHLKIAAPTTPPASWPNTIATKHHKAPS